MSMNVITHTLEVNVTDIVVRSSHECPHIDRSFVPAEDVNKPIDYKTMEFDFYRFYEHTDPKGKKSKVQFCELIGRKKDVFECFNTYEWKYCPYLSSNEGS